ncbi:MAG: hypothetical protein ACREGA_01125 [Candidatus Saccharimonadales bacterium]
MSELLALQAGETGARLREADLRPYLQRTEIGPIINDLALGIINDFPSDWQPADLRLRLPASQGQVKLFGDLPVFSQFIGDSLRISLERFCSDPDSQSMFSQLEQHLYKYCGQLDSRLTYYDRLKLILD